MCSSWAQLGPIIFPSIQQRCTHSVLAPGAGTLSKQVQPLPFWSLQSKGTNPGGAIHVHDLCKLAMLQFADLTKCNS